MNPDVNTKFLPDRDRDDEVTYLEKIYITNTHILPTTEKCTI